jgi:uncharacterized protein (TIGR00730 family)
MSKQIIKETKKAYENLDFLNSKDARVIRMLSEYLEPEARFKKYNVRETVVFFGSARLLSKKDATAQLKEIKSADPKKTQGYAEKRQKAQVALEMSKYYEDAVKLAKMLTEWSMTLTEEHMKFIICTGGGPGIMEAANKGAKAAGGQSVGLNISIPFEQFVNKYVTDQLKLEFHYFFMRKFWFSYLAKALIVFPGGFGTMDEFFEILTLRQTGKIKRPLLVIGYDEKFWKKVVNFDALVEHGVVSKADLSLIRFCSTPEEAFKEVTEHFVKFPPKKR